ncbi:MAG: hypothetical protein DBX47_03010 [Clostridiales bacterium]|nr:MAG: hypothetical protein DBX47_03010 [Clostridiales bacterium]
MEQIRIITAAFSENDLKLISDIIEDETFKQTIFVQPNNNGLQKAGTQPADVLIICTTGNTDDELDFAERMYMTRGDLTIILLCANLTTQIIDKAMLSGVGRVIDINSTSDEIKTAILETYNRTKNRIGSVKTNVSTYESKIISVFCPKGGTGKTTISVNLAVSLASIGKKVALVDFDLQFGDVAVFLDITKADSIYDLVEENNFELSSIKSYLIRHYSGISVMLAPSTPEYAELIKATHIEKILTKLRSEFDYIIIDMTPAFNDCSIAALDLSDIVYFIVTEDISTIRNAKTCFGILDMIGVSSKIQLIVNKDGISTITVKDVEDVLGTTAVVVLPNEQKTTTHAINCGVPVVLSDKKSKFTHAMLSFAKSLATEK